MDNWGLGWSATHISGDFRNVLNNLRVSFDSIEHAVEDYYNIELSPAIHFSFDMQYIINNAGAAFTRTGTMHLGWKQDCSLIFENKFLTFTIEIF
jgi:carbohydrate-selective porin OprB